MKETLIAAFADRDDADGAVMELEDRGFDAKELSVIAKKDAPDRGENVLKGVTTGGVVGGLAGLLAGAGVVPVVAGLFIGGPIAVALGLTGIAATTISGAVTGALAGGLIGALTDLGLSSEEAEAYEQTVNEGGVILAVPVTEPEKNNVREVLERHHASQVKDIQVPARAAA